MLLVPMEPSFEISLSRCRSSFRPELLSVVSMVALGELSQDVES